MRFAILAGGVVVNVVEWDGLMTTWSPPSGQTAVSVQTGVAIGWTYDGNNFIAPGQPPLTPEQQAAVNATNAGTARRADMAAQPDCADLLQRIQTATPAQIDNWIDTNVTTLVAARAVLKAIVKCLARSA